MIETVACVGPVAGLFGGEDTPSAAGSTPGAIKRLDVGSPADMRLEGTEPVSGAHAGVSDAERVVAVGRGLSRRRTWRLSRTWPER